VGPSESNGPEPRGSAPSQGGGAAEVVPASNHGGGGGGGSHGGGGGGSHGGNGGGSYHGGGNQGGGSGGSHHSGGDHGGGFHGGGFHNGGGFHGGFHGGGFRGYYYPSFWGSFYFGYPYPYWYYGPWGYYYNDGYYRDGYYRDRDEQGALDLDLSPADTQVYVDGQYIGKVDDFDGWPQYLWLDPGTYDITFYREGYKTLSRQVTIYRGLVIDWDDRLEQGPSIRPEDLSPKTHERRDARIQQDKEMRDQAEHGRQQGDWHDRVRGERSRRYDRDDDRDRRDRDDRDRADDSTAPRSGDARSGRLHLAIEPHDASVYLDGRFLGTADDVARMSSGLLVDPGQHTLSVVRPGRHAEEQHFDVKAGQQLDLKIDLRTE
jgi:hypothetical protein